MNRPYNELANIYRIARNYFVQCNKNENSTTVPWMNEEYNGCVEKYSSDSPFLQ